MKQGLGDEPHYLKKRKLSVGERIAFVIALPFLVVMAMSPYAMLRYGVLVFPVAFALYWMVKIVQSAFAKRRNVNYGSSGLRVRSSKRIGVHHHWTVTTQPKDE